MTQEQIKHIFSQGYNRTNWKKFLSEAFPGAEILKSPEPLLGIDTNIAKSAYQLGQIAIRENGIERSIAVFEVTLADGIVLERNRVGLRNLLRRYWKDLDAAFIAYTKSDSQRWRFTYVSELTGYDAEGEAINIKTEPKRYTYVLGEGESIRTACERFASIAAKGIKATLDDVKEAFSVEKLSKSFFDEYKKQYAEFCRYMIAKPNINAALFNGDEKAIRDFNKKLLGRIVFLYFIQKKGWLGVPVRSEWGQGDYNFLTHQFENFRNKDLFYRDFLSVLFFETLNCKRGDDLFNYDNTKFINKPENALVKIPYLNGGLFEEENIKHRELIVDAELFRSLFDFFNQYNFTIYEDDPNDHTVAVDPEMLGHIFENLLEDNKDKGAFYTPKEIVHYMCQESLIEYLCTTLKIEDEAKEREAITNLLKKKEIDEILKPEIQNINHALDAVKICDPAIGSGAFPMGLLHEIFTAKQTLYAFEAGNSIGFDASGTKLNIIQNSIYGVDIEKGAVDIARLRFWLSLIVDESEPKPLPNLDYKIVVGNSLVSKFGDDILEIDWNLNATAQENIFGSSDIRDEKARIIEKIIKEQKEFFNPTGDKKTLAADVRNLKIDLLINQLQLMAKTKGLSKIADGLKGKALKEATELFLQTNSWKQSIAELTKLKTQPGKALEFFDWKLDFPEIMNENVNPNTGFDIVIGNPPYGAKYELKEKEVFLKKYTSTKTIKELQKGSLDTYTIFIELGQSLTKIQGTLHYIVPMSITSSDSMIGIQKLIESKCSLIRISSYSNRPKPVFENAFIKTSILFIKKDNRECNTIETTKMYRKNSECGLEYLLSNLKFINVIDYKLRGRYPKISFEVEKQILHKVLHCNRKIETIIDSNGDSIYYRAAGGRYYNVVTNYPTYSSAEKSIKIKKEYRNLVGAILSSSLYWWFQQVITDCLNLKSYEILSFGFPETNHNKSIIAEISNLYELYLKDIESNASIRNATTRTNIETYKEYKISKSRHLINIIDNLICSLYGLNEEQTIFIKHYESEFRTDEEE